MTQRPEETFRIGLCSAAIWCNQAGEEGRTFRSVVIERRYRDEGGEWRSSSSFTLADLPVARALLKLAEEYVASREARSARDRDD